MKLSLSPRPFGVGTVSLGLTLLISLFGCTTVPPVTAAPPQSTTPQSGSGEKPIPPNGAPVIAGDATATLKLQGGAAQGSVTTVPVTGQPFANALRLTSAGRTNNVYDVQATADVPRTIKKGDVLLATFYMRCVEGQPETGEARTEFVLEINGEPYSKYVSQEASAGKEWKRIFIPVEIKTDIPAAGTHVCFRMGYGKQTFDIAGFQLLNYGSSVTLNDLPRTRATYAGSEENAAWRREAEARIEKIRKGDITIVVKDASGKIVPGAKISLRQQKHAFGFGSAVSAQMLAAQGPDGDKYRAFVLKYCPKVVLENDLKWPQYEQNPERAKQAVAWLNQNGIAVKGHNLIWPSFKNMPADIKGIAGDKAKLAKRIDDHIVQEVTAMKGQVVEWDVINEPFTNHDAMDVLGRDAMIHWFQLARTTDPKPRLTLNDYPPLDGSATQNKHLNSFYDNIDYLKKNGAPIEGIGFQCHFGGTLVSPTNVLSGMDRFGKFGLPLTVTEFDMNTNDQQLQAMYMRDFMTAAFSHPQVDTILMWGFWEGAHWLPDAALFSRDWKVRPHGQVYMDLVGKTWWTNADGTTDAKGAWKGRGFYGNYTVTVTPAKGAAKTLPVKIVKGDANVVEVRL